MDLLIYALRAADMNFVPVDGKLRVAVGAFHRLFRMVAAMPRELVCP